MFRALRKRAIEAFLRRSTPAGKGAARRKDSLGVPLAPGASVMPQAMPRPDVPTVTFKSGSLELAGKRAVRIPAQAHRAPYLEDMDDWY
jgi:hypothetical protein